MAATLDITTVFKIDGLYSGNEVIPNKFTSATTPAEVVKGCPVTGTTATSLDLGDIAAGSGFSLYLEALVGNFYIKLGATTGTPGATDSHLYIKSGEGYIIPINPNATATPGIRFVGDSATAKLMYCLVGS